MVRTCIMPTGLGPSVHFLGRGTPLDTKTIFNKSTLLCSSRSTHSCTRLMIERAISGCSTAAVVRTSAEERLRMWCIGVRHGRTDTHGNIGY